VDGKTEALRAADSAQVSEEILGRVSGLAGELGHPVRLTTVDDQGSWPLIVHPDGNVESGGDPILTHVAEPSPVPQLQPEPTPEPTPVAEPMVTPLTLPVPVQETEPAPIAHTESQPNGRASFLREETRPNPASRGLRGVIAKTGIRVKPSRKELAERADIHAVSQHWPGPRTIAVVNGKGGAN
jgi:hypothetical protein